MGSKASKQKKKYESVSHDHVPLDKYFTIERSFYFTCYYYNSVCNDIDFSSVVTYFVRLDDVLSTCPKDLIYLIANYCSTSYFNFSK